MSGLPLVGFSVFNGLAPLTKDGADGAPIQGPRVIMLDVTFSVAKNQTDLEFFQENSDKQLDFVQTICIDNSASSLSVTALSLVTGHRIICPPQAQMIMPIFTIDQTQIRLTKAVVGADETIRFHFLNVPLPAIVWKVT